MKGKVFTITGIILFSLIIIVRLYLDISRTHSIRMSAFFLPIAFIFIFCHKSKIAWLLAIGLFVYGIYYYLFQRVMVAEPGAFEFTLPLQKLFFGDEHGYRTNRIMWHYLSLFPFMFYIVLLVIYMTKRVRQEYWKKNI